MEKSRAIEVLKPLANSFVDYANITMKEEDDDTAEALEMAIEALKAQLSQEGTTKDAISRQAAIDAIHEDILLKPHNDSWFRENHEFVTVGYVERTLLAVPSAQPDLIRRSEVIEAIDDIDWYHQNASKEMVSGASNEHEAWYKAEDVYKAMESVPSAQPERMNNR